MSALEVEWADVEHISGGALGEFDGACPSCGPERRHGVNRIRKVLRVWRSEPGYASFFCARCGARGWVRPEVTAACARPRGALLRAFDPVRVAPSEEAAEAARRSAWAEFSFFAADPIDSTLAETYLAGRGLTPGLDMRFVRNMPRTYDGPGVGPAMIVAVRGPDGAVVGCQATYLDPEGRKLHRLTFGRVGGCAVRLHEIGPEGVLAVAEGVESGLAFTALYDVPAWAALSATGIEGFTPPPGLERLVIAADNDVSGRGMEAARRLAQRACKACEVHISAPAGVNDWNDVLTQQERAA